MGVMAKNNLHEGSGPTQRQLRVGETVLNRLSITVGEVRMSPDLKIATAYVLPLGGEGQDEVLKLLARNKNELRRQVAKKLTLKFSPDLRFQLDRTFDQMDDTRRMMNQDVVRRDADAPDDDATDGAADQ